MDIISMAYARKLVNGLQSGLDHASVDNNTCSITFHWKDGTFSTMKFPKPLDGANGVGISDVKLKKINIGGDKETHLICLLDDGTEIDAGKIPVGKSEIKEFDVTTASSTWSIQHNLNATWYQLSINIIDTDNNVVFGDIDVANSTNNLLIIKFNTPIAGKITIKK